MYTPLIRRRVLVPSALVALAALAALTLAACQTNATLPAELSWVPAGELSGHTDSVLEVALSPDGTQLASASLDDTARVWDLASGRQTRLLPHPDDVYSVVFHPSLPLLATACRDGKVRLWSLSEETEPMELEGNALAVYSVVFSPDGARVASAGEDLSVRIWDTTSGESLKVLTGHTEKVQDVAFSPDGKLIATGSSDRTVRLWRGSDGGLVKILRPPNVTKQVSEMSVSFSPDSTRLLSAGAKSTTEDPTNARIWSVAGLKQSAILTGQQQEIWDIRYLRPDTYIGGAGREGKVFFWRESTGTLVSTLDVKSGPLWSFTQSLDGNTLYVATTKRGIQVFVRA